MRYRRLKYIIFGFTAILIISISSFYFQNSPFDLNKNEENNNFDQLESVKSPKIPKSAAGEPNGKPLLVQQYANISRSFNDVNSGENVSFTLYNDWISQNTTINYEGIEQKKDIITNGRFDSDDSGWDYKTNAPTKLDKKDWSDGITGIEGPNTGRSLGDYGYLEQNITLQNEELQDNIATFSFDYNSEWGIFFNASLFMSVIIGNIEINHSIYTLDISPASWFTLSMNYNPITFGQVLPGVVTIRVGIIMNEDSGPGWLSMFLDNFKCELWTNPNEEGIIKAYDNQFPQNHTYYNTTFGEGYSFIDTERTPDSDNLIEFTIYNNRSEVSDLHIGRITIISHAIKKFNSTVSNKLGSIYSLGEIISWQVEFSLIIHNNYYCWVLIEKPSEWEFIHAIDSFQVDKIEFCLGKDIGSKLMKIPLEHTNEGLWKLEARSQNYISNGTIRVWDNTAFVFTTKLTIDDLFKVEVTLNDSISLPNTNINCTIFYPNASILWQSSREPTSYNEKFGNFTVGKNMTIGNYKVTIEWVNNLSSLDLDQVGYIELNFIVWHSTNLTAVDSYIEKIAGDPCLIKVNYTDYDLDTYIALASVTYNSTFGQSGSMIYIGSGTYFLDLDTSSLLFGEYYFSFNASKTYYENQTEINLIRLKIITQPLAIEVPGSAVNAIGNDHAICQVNVTGALTGVLITDGANVTTDWNIGYSITEHFNGTYTLNFSTDGIPTQGFLQSFTINILANKTNYGSTSNFITMIVHPVPTAISVNESLHNLYLNEKFYVKVNYTIEASGTHISGASWTINWSSNYDVTPVADGYIVEFDTIGLTIDAHAALIEMEQVGYETEYTSVTVVINSQKVNLSLSIDSQQVQENNLDDYYFNDIISLSSRAYVEGEQTYLNNCILTFINGNYEKNLTKSVNYWYNTSITISTSDFNIGNNYVYIRFTHVNYSAVSFSFQIFVKQISIGVDIEDSVEGFAGETVTIEVKLTDSESGIPIEDADITYEWEYGVGEFEEKDDGVYEVEIEIPENIEGNYDLDLIITSSGSVYKSSEEDLTITVKARELPEYWIWIIIAALSVGVGLLATISLRAYVFLPRAREKQSELLAKTQNFKDMRSVQAIVLIHRESGLPIYYKTYSFLEKADAHLFSGFVQAITTIGKEIAESDKGAKAAEKQRKYAEHMMEIDFKYFYALIYDQEDLRIVLILSERSSDALREKLKELSTIITDGLSDSIKNFSGLLEPFEDTVPAILSKSIDLHYKEFFKTSKDNALFIKTKKERDFTSMETRLFNVLTSYSKGGNNFALDSIFKMISEKSEDLIIEAIESLIQRKLIIPASQKEVMKSSKGSNYK